VSARRSAYAGQARAATYEARQIATRWAARTDADRRSGAENAATAHLMAELNDRIAHGLPTCGHLAGGPKVGWWVAWKPERMRCDRCARDETRSTRDDQRCDGCNRAGDPIRPRVLQDESVVILLGLCGDCEAGQ